MERTVCVFLLVFCFENQPLALCHAQAVDTDADGLRDLLDVPEFDPNASESVSFGSLNIEDLDGANLLTNLQSLDLTDNRITSIESGDFAGLTNLQSLDLRINQITSVERGDFTGLPSLQTLRLAGNSIASIESGAFEGLASLQELGLKASQFTELNLTNATFENLQSCVSRYASGFCVDSGKITTLILDDATLSRDSIRRNCWRNVRDYGCLARRSELFGW